MVVITGTGMVSALGLDAATTRAAMLEGRSGIHPIRQLETRYRGEWVAGEIDLSDEQLAARAKVSGEEFGRAAVLAILAARQALEGVEPAARASIGLINSTTVGGVGRSERYYHLLAEQPQHLGCLDTHDCADSTRRVADQLGLRGRMATLSTACASSANAVMLGARWIQSGLLDQVLAGGADALSRFTVNGFKALMILDQQWCQPFDENRRGLNLGEAGAYLLLESEASARRRGARSLGVVRGYGNAADAFHQTASSPDGRGPQLAMRKALALAGVNTVDCVNAHGTGTSNNDASETAALRAVFGEQVPPFSSTKPYTGHTLAAAGAVEAILSLLSLQEQVIFPSLNIAQPMQGAPPAVRELTRAPLQVVLSNSFGFGGSCTSLVLGRA